MSLHVWRCNLCGCDGLRCTCMGGDMVRIYVCTNCKFPTALKEDKGCRNCGNDRLIDRDTKQPKQG